MAGSDGKDLIGRSNVSKLYTKPYKLPAGSVLILAAYSAVCFYLAGRMVKRTL